MASSRAPKSQRVAAQNAENHRPRAKRAPGVENGGAGNEEEGQGDAAVAGLMEFWEETRQDELMIRELAAVATPCAGFKVRVCVSQCVRVCVSE